MRFFSADTIFDGKEFMPAGTVLVFDANGACKDVVPPERATHLQAQHFNGTLCPGFVNAHCHLELSHLHGKIPQHTGLPAFAQQVIQQREAGAEAISGAMALADQYMREHGIVAVGDICNTPHSLGVKVNSSIYYHSFVELLALNPARSEAVFESGLALLHAFSHAGLRASLAPHAPYSTSKALIGKIAAHNAQEHLPLSIHNQESTEEEKFFKGVSGGFDALYRFLNIDVSWFRAPGTSSLQHYGPVLTQAGSILVHNTFTHPEDLNAVSGKKIWWCLCPAANLYIENSLPAFSLFEPHWQNLCLGTDSLASNTTLNLCDEASILLSKTTAFSLKQVLRCITYNGAAALGLENKFGSFVPGTHCGLNLIEAGSNAIRFKQKLV